MNISKKSLIEGLSYALDLAEGRYFSHSKHVAYTSLMIGKTMKMTKVELSELYYTALLHDIGAGNNYDIKEHAEKGAKIVRNLLLSSESVEAIRYHHEFNDGSGSYGLIGDEIPLMSRIIVIANLLDIKIQECKIQLEKTLDYEIHDKIINYLQSLTGYVDYEILNTLISIIEKPYFLLSYVNIRFDDILRHTSKHLLDENYGFSVVKKYAEAFSEIIDQRNPFTYNHSVGLASLTQVVSDALGYDDAVKEELYIASLLHDIGKLAVDNDIINKNGKLTKEERYSINKHTYYTRFVLTHITGFEHITKWASNHHERLDGSGYPFGFTAKELDEQDRLLAILDIYQALTEERPYRIAFSKEKVYSILEDDVSKGKIDGKLLKKIKPILESVL